MGRLRSRLATTDRDRTVQRLLADAVRKAREAQQLCNQAAREGLPRGRRSAQAIQQAINLMESIGFLVPSYDMTDPDLMSEDQKRPNWFRRPQPGADAADATAALGDTDGT